MISTTQTRPWYGGRARPGRTRLYDRNFSELRDAEWLTTPAAEYVVATGRHAAGRHWREVAAREGTARAAGIEPFFGWESRLYTLA